MKISIENFKSISALHNFELKPFTVLSGKNSSGKSSFIQLLLILKQTIEKSSTKDIFVINDEYYSGEDFISLIYKKKSKNDILFSFKFDKSEFSNSKNPLLVLANEVDIEISLKEHKGKPIIKLFNIKTQLDQTSKEPYLKILSNNSLYKIESNDNSFGEGIWGENIEHASIDFEAFYPNSFSEKEGIKKFIKIDWAKKIINLFLSNIYYLGPDRESPKVAYSTSKQTKTVGIKGEFTAQLLQQKANETIEYYEIINKDKSVEYEQKKGHLSDAIKFWMCEVFGVAKNIYSEKKDDTYRIFLETENGLKVNIKHVGYGISQLLPIIVEGLIMPKNGTLIIEQPEIHLHPKIQSQLFDFLYSLILQGKKVIVETHSSHFITRMRRRVAESQDKIYKKINLTFIENDIFRTIKLDDFGSMEYFPKDFIEQDTEELKAIVEAQMNKRLKDSTNG